MRLLLSDARGVVVPQIIFDFQREPGVDREPPDIIEERTQSLGISHTVAAPLRAYYHIQLLVKISCDEEQHFTTLLTKLMLVFKARHTL